jgi:hypothetical protein
MNPTGTSHGWQNLFYEQFLSCCSIIACVHFFLLCSRGLPGFLEDIEAANKLAVCFRLEGSQLYFICMSAPGALNEFNFRARGKVGVKRVRLNAQDTIDPSTMASRCRESCKVLSYRRFAMVLKKMQADAEVAMQIQIALR